MGLTPIRSVRVGVAPRSGLRHGGRSGEEITTLNGLRPGSGVTTPHYLRTSPRAAAQPIGVRTPFQ